MPSFFRTRLLPFLAVFAVFFLLNGLAVQLIFARGFGFMLGVPGTVFAISFTATLALGCRLVLTSVKKLSPDETALVFRKDDLRDLALGTLTGVVAVGLVVGLLVVSGFGALRWKGVPAWVLSVAIVAFPINAAFQQIGIQSLNLSLRKQYRMTVGAAIVPLLFFVGPHISPTSTPLYVLNVALFGALSILLFFRSPKPSYGAVVGLHGGWNTAMMLFGALPESEGQTAFSWSPITSFWSGGSAGVESGAAYTLVLGLVGLGVVMLVRLSRSSSVQ